MHDFSKLAESFVESFIENNGEIPNSIKLAMSYGFRIGLEVGKDLGDLYHPPQDLPIASKNDLNDPLPSPRGDTARLDELIGFKKESR